MLFYSANKLTAKKCIANNLKAKLKANEAVKANDLIHFPLLNTLANRSASENP